MSCTTRNWPEIMQELEESGLSVKEYARQSNIPYSTICNHRSKAHRQMLSCESHGSGQRPMCFVRIDNHDIDDHGSGIKIRVGKAIIEIDETFDSMVLAKVLEVLHAGA